MGSTSQTTQQPGAQNSVQDHQARRSAEGMPVPSSVPRTPLAEAVAQTNPYGARLLESWQTRIEFYGMVVDENTNSIAGANVQFAWIETPSEAGEKSATTESDAEGRFSLQGKRGASLTVTVNKAGYYALHGQKTFHYAVLGNFVPSFLNPVVFKLRKKRHAEPLIHIGGIGLHAKRDYLLSAEGKPTCVSLLTGQLMPSEQGDLEVAFQAGPPVETYPSRITWKCQVTVPSGGLIQTDEEFPFFAPEGGYRTSEAWNITTTNWTDTVNQQYYVKLRNGNYGRINLRVIGVPSRAYFRMESYVNPSGSRNLEPAN
jgi:hypothetical protein